MNNNRGKPLPAAVVKQIQRLREQQSLRKTACATNTSVNTVRKYARKAS